MLKGKSSFFTSNYRRNCAGTSTVITVASADVEEMRWTWDSSEDTQSSFIETFSLTNASKHFHSPRDVQPEMTRWWCGRFWKRFMSRYSCQSETQHDGSHHGHQPSSDRFSNICVVINLRNNILETPNPHEDPSASKSHLIWPTLSTQPFCLTSSAR